MFKSASRACLFLQGMFWISYCLAFGFLVAYLTGRGYSSSQVGVLVAILAVTTIVAQPLYGYLSDKKVDIKKLVIGVLIASTLLVALVPIAAASFWTMVPLCIGLGATEYGLNSLIDCWCVRLSGKHPVNFGVARAGGSFAYAVTASLFGFLLSRIPMEMTFYLHIAICLGTLFVAIMTEGAPPIKLSSEPGEEAGTEKPKGRISTLLKDKRYVVFVICSAITWIGCASTGSFMINLLELKGGTAEHLGYALAVQALAEVPTMYFSVKLFKKFNLRFLIIFALFVFSLKQTLPALTGGPIGIIAVMLLQGVSFAVFLPAVMRYITTIAPRGLESTATTLAVSVYTGVGNILGNLLGGVIADSMGIIWVYLLSGMLSLVSAVVFLIFGGEKLSGRLEWKKLPRRTAEAISAYKREISRKIRQKRHM